MAKTDDLRPPVAIGHVRLPSSDVAKSAAWLVRCGLRSLLERDDFAVLELRGGTHLVVHPSDTPIPAGTPAGFDLMVDDVEATHTEYAALGMDPSAIRVGRIHSSFTIVEPGGHEVTVNSSHAGDRPV